MNLEFERPAEGLAALAGVAAMTLPRIKTQVVREVGGPRVETVYFRGAAGKTVLGRWYDKGVESGLAERGCLIRPEAQWRFAKGARLPVDVIAQGSFVRDSFVKRFEPLWRAAKGVKVARPEELVDRVVELVEDGEISSQQAERMIGALYLDGHERDPRPGSTARRHRAECRDQGLVVADGVVEEVEVDLGDVIEEALDAGRWGQG